MLDKVRRGIREPIKIGPYLLGKALSGSTLKKAQSYQPNWKKEDDFYTFEEGGFAGGAKDRPGFAARNFYEVTQIEAILQEAEIDVDRSVEIGSGYGRLSPWFAQFSSSHFGIEPNEDAVERASELYPHIEFRHGRIQEAPLDTDDFGLVVTWTVLQHIPPSSITEAVQSILDLSADTAYFLICEETQGAAGSHTWPRSVEAYDELFSGKELIDTQSRNLEPGYTGHGARLCCSAVSNLEPTATFALAFAGTIVLNVGNRGDNPQPPCRPQKFASIRRASLMSLRSIPSESNATITNRTTNTQ